MLKRYVVSSMIANDYTGEIRVKAVALNALSEDEAYGIEAKSLEEEFPGNHIEKKILVTPVFPDDVWKVIYKNNANLLKGLQKLREANK